MNESKLTDLIIKIVFGKLYPMEKHVKAVVEKLVSTAFISGMIIGWLIMSIIFLLFELF